MIIAATKFFWFLSPTRITGPIFDKELRVASRRKRTYVLRTIYIGLLALFVAGVWTEAISHDSFDRRAGVLIASQMSEIGTEIISAICWFQFIIMPVLSIILLSNAISSEIRNKTICVLASTPVNSFQIVMGKISSKTFQIILLMGIAFPMLAIVRVFGGVSWDYIISTFCVTLSLVIFAGSLSLFLSIYIKKAYAVIIWAIIPIFIVYALSEKIWDCVYADLSEILVMIFNPLLVMSYACDEIIYPGGISYSPTIMWMTHCGISLFCSMVILLKASAKVRKAALTEATGQLSPLKRWLNSESENEFCGIAKPKKEKPIRPISDNPVIWREARSPVFVKRKFLRIASILVVSIGSVIAFFIGIFSALMNQGDYLQLFVLGFMIYGAIFTVIFPASCIPAEKESRSWVMLMSTSLTDRQILIGKFVGILRKCMFPWSLLLLFLLYTSVLQITHPITVIFITLNIISVIALLSGTGLFVGTLFRKANGAVVANILLAAAVWAIIPIICEFLGRRGNDIQLFCMSMNPFYQAGVVMDLANFRGNFTTLEYRWPMERLGPGMTLLTITISTIIHIATGAFFVFCAKKRLRKNIF
ncbi:MAG: ABC transporter permease [Phycisphaerae bacterium]|nr:ABC transporter permease [Phycisphaerae bacterium]